MVDRPGLRIDWFDGSVVEGPVSTTSSQGFILSDIPDSWDEIPVADVQPPKNLMGFKDLLYLSQQEPSNIILKLSCPTTFWNLLDSDMKDDYCVLLIKIFGRLFLSLKTEDNSFVLRQLLKEKFLPSQFIYKLNNYLCSVVNVKESEKDNNKLFWIDTGSVYGNVLDICCGMCFDKESSEKALDLIEACNLSINDAINDHGEDIQYLLHELNEARHTIYEVIDNPTLLTEPSFNFFETNPVLGHLNIFPRREDIFENSIKIKPNIINGAYLSVDHYLELQFNLLREDYVGSLRDGISKYLTNQQRSYDNIRVHQKVRFLKSYVYLEQIGFLINIEGLKHRHKQFINGSLLLFTCDQFDTILCATVLNSDDTLLDHNNILVTLHTPVSKNIWTRTYVMVESDVYFEPYHWVMKVLQHYGGKDVPMSKYIVHVKPDIKPPGYLKPNTVYTIRSKTKEILIPVLDLEKYPEKFLDLDQSQLEAFKLALTREFVLIQGPPGTGKSFMGNTIAATLLNNVSLQGNPILVICYTNHALDQFIEGMIEVTQNIVRLGSQSKNPKMAQFSLAKFRKRFGKRRNVDPSILNNLIQKVRNTQESLEKCDKGLLDYETIKEFLQIGSKKYYLNSNKNEDPVLAWLFDVDCVIDNECAYACESETEDVLMELNVNTCFAINSYGETESLENIMKQAKLITDDENEITKIVDKFNREADKINLRLKIYKDQCAKLEKSEISKKELRVVPDLYKLTLDERWTLYFKIVERIKELLLQKLYSYHNDYKKHLIYKEDLAAKSDAIIMKHASIVGVTTSGAARRHTLLQELKSQIVIVEEAGEIYESHVIASLTRHCKHLILIGDHKQLRLNAANHKLAKEYNIEVSLFERMIRNGIHAHTLTVQRRMRPIFVDLLVPMIYDRLDSHPVMTNYPHVSGMANDLYFCNHNFFEDGNTEDSRSHKNSLEANWCVALAKYLIMQKYEPADITILCTYNAQAELICKLSSKHQAIKKCRITVVDNYQGEENKIVILSLVRSNRDNNIGFLSAQNRVCVALSRAREGLSFVCFCLIFARL